MGRMFILQGAPGCGKSTFLERNGLGDFTVSPDRFRRIIDPSPAVYDEASGGMVVGYDFSPRVSALTFQLARAVVSERMDREETVIIDSVAAKRRTISRILAEARSHAYEVYYVDMQKDLTLDEVLKRNASRGIRAISEDVVADKYEACARYDLMKGETRISAEDMLDMMWVEETDLDRYESVRVIGDVQGCFSRLRESGVTDQVGRDDIALVFSGDMFDRGPDDESGPMFDWLADAATADNVFLVRGNHDSYIRWYGVEGGERNYSASTAKTISGVLHGSSKVSGSEKRLRRMSRGIYGRMTTMLPFRFRGGHYMVTHGGLHPSVIDSARGSDVDGLRRYRLGFMSGQEGWYGSGTTVNTGDYRIDIDAIIEHDRSADSPIQIHGHRNEHRHEPDGFSHVFNLETRVEHDGYLSVLRIEDDGSRTVDKYGA